MKLRLLFPLLLCTLLAACAAPRGPTTVQPGEPAEPTVPPVVQDANPTDGRCAHCGYILIYGFRRCNCRGRYGPVSRGHGGSERLDGFDLLGELLLIGFCAGSGVERALGIGERRLRLHQGELVTKLIYLSFVF